MADEGTGHERELARGQAAVQATRSTIENRMIALEAELSSLRLLWRGHASQAVAQSIEQCQEQADRLRSAFLELESALSENPHADADTIPGFRRHISGLSSLMSA